MAKMLPVTLAVTTLLAAFCAASPVAGQAGSVGGAIGKQEKSALGHDGAKAAKQVPSRRARAVYRSGKTKETSRAEGCGNIAGTWTAVGWHNAIYGRGDVTLSADGTARHVSGIPGNWTCKNRKFVLDWPNWGHGEGTLSADGNRVVDTNGTAWLVRGR